MGRGKALILLKECNSALDVIAANPDHHFEATLTKVRCGLPALFSGDYPLVITHGDLSEMNLLVDPLSGKITGIVDWAETSIQPFGFTLRAR